MASANHSYVQYFIPYDGDTEEHPNVFLVKKPQKDLKLVDVQQAFPLPGQYFFRAKTAYGKTHVWLDLNDPSDPVPAFNGKVTLKASRVSLAVSNAPSSSPSAAAVRSAPAPAPAPVSQRAAAPAPAPAPVSAPAPAPSLLGSPPAASAAAHHDDLLGVFSSPPASAPAPAARAGAGAAPLGGFGGAPQAAAAGFVDPFAVPVARPGQAAPGWGAGQGQAGGQQQGGGQKKGASILDGDIFNM